MDEQHHRSDGPEFEQTLGDSEGQGSLSKGSQRVGHDLVSKQQVHTDKS